MASVVRAHHRGAKFVSSVFKVVAIIIALFGIIRRNRGLRAIPTAGIRRLAQRAAATVEESQLLFSLLR